MTYLSHGYCNSLNDQTICKQYIGIGELEKRQPFIAGKCDEVNAVGVLLMFKMNGYN
jgi:hypothetical protein